MRSPSAKDLPQPWLDVARRIAGRLGERGSRAWIVGGAVRDLALGREPVDVDMACAAPPEEIQALFDRTLAVGRAFGTIVVHFERDVQVTTFRSESGYSDARRPDEVRWGATPEEDSRRRDFTCNALYLDPLDDTLLDPQGGLADLERGVLRTVGDPGERFREDGLRLVRMARFAAQLDLAVEPEVLAAARREAAALAGVSPERCLAELTRILDGRDPARGLGLLREAGLLGRLLPAFDEGWGDGGAAQLAALARLGPGVGCALGLAMLLDPHRAAAPDGEAAAAGILEALRPSRELRRAVGERWRLAAAVRSALVAASGGSLGRAERVRLVREGAWPDVVRWLRVAGEGGPQLEALESFAAGLPADERFPAPLLGAADLEARGVPRSARWGALLSELETQQLEGRLRTREQALAWLAAQPL